MYTCQNDTLLEIACHGSINKPDEPMKRALNTQTLRAKENPIRNIQYAYGTKWTKNHWPTKMIQSLGIHN